MTTLDRQKIMAVALEIATEGHAGVFRNDKKTPYIEHPKAVAKIAVEEYLAYTSKYFPHLIGKDHVDDMVMLITIGAYFHDLIEDVEKWINKEAELVSYLEERSGYILEEKTLLIDGLKRLNKHNFPSYLEFILAAMKNVISDWVKVGDLTHNTSDLGKGSLREKYVLSLYIIKQNKQ